MSMSSMHYFCVHGARSKYATLVSIAIRLRRSILAGRKVAHSSLLASRQKRLSLHQQRRSIKSQLVNSEWACQVQVFDSIESGIPSSCELAFFEGIHRDPTFALLKRVGRQGYTTGVVCNHEHGPCSLSFPARCLIPDILNFSTQIGLQRSHGVSE
jgi:hypothetical protein